MPLIRMNAFRTAEDAAVPGEIIEITTGPVGISVGGWQKNVRARIGGPLTVIRNIAAADMKIGLQVVFGVECSRSADLLEIAYADSCFAFVLGLVQSWQQHRRQDGDDGD